MGREAKKYRKNTKFQRATSQSFRNMNDFTSDRKSNFVQSTFKQAKQTPNEKYPVTPEGDIKEKLCILTKQVRNKSCH